MCKSEKLNNEPNWIKEICKVAHTLSITRSSSIGMQPTNTRLPHPSMKIRRRLEHDVRIVPRLRKFLHVLYSRFYSVSKWIIYARMRKCTAPWDGESWAHEWARQRRRTLRGQDGSIRLHWIRNLEFRWERALCLRKEKKQSHARARLNQNDSYLNRLWQFRTLAAS